MGQDQARLIPTRDELVAWADKCIKLLGKKRSNFLNTGLPSGKNRVGVLLGSKTRLNMILVRELQLELLAEAERQGIELPELICQKFGDLDSEGDE